MGGFGKSLVARGWSRNLSLVVGGSERQTKDSRPKTKDTRPKTQDKRVGSESPPTANFGGRDM
ncbi:MAG: hypothetical protein ACYS18_02315 [Planctomycetota bacterium]